MADPGPPDDYIGASLTFEDVIFTDHHELYFVIEPDGLGMVAHPDGVVDLELTDLERDAKLSISATPQRWREIIAGVKDQLPEADDAPG